MIRPILLVEDNPMDLDLTRRAFTRRRLANPLLVARDGAEAIELIDGWAPEQPAPAIVLLDLKLPKVDGLDVLRHLRAHPGLGAVPVVILTTSTEDQDVQAAYRLGANSYIVKPVDFEKFMAVVAQIDLYWLVLNYPPNP
ncbi:MAG TPA: response regulator [Chloroflexaceae bacterium]|nr:response regulator [Chloroflexaceae bacterium]